MDFRKLDRKWQKKWEMAKLFEANPGNGKKFFTSLIIPYVNGGLHIGHTFTYTRTDAYARYKRMQGFNVLLAQGFHATGQPILGTVERIRNNDKAQLETFRLYGATEKDIGNFREKGAEYVARFWTKKIIEEMKSVGFSIDWRRMFITAIQPAFSRFIEWQYNTLRKKGYVTQGTHPVIWCPHCMSPTGDHDRLEGEGESPIEFTILKFKFGDMYLVAATLRPETVFGQTNMWVNPDVNYAIILVDGKEKWIASKECTEKLKDQLKKMEIIGSISGKEIIGKYCTAPMINRDIIILPARFCDPQIGTGLVTSVPSHAPFDWQALVDLKNNPSELEKYGISLQVLKELKPVSIIKVEGFGEHPAQDIIEKIGIKDQNEWEKLKEALHTIYTKEHHTGVMKTNCGEYSGLSVETAKEQIKKRLIKENLADVMWETTDTVVCRCTTRNHVKILENQWFLKYSDEIWKRLTKKCLDRMTIYPEEARSNFLNTIDWLKDKACARKSGLGTPLPWDKEWIVETLSDSTIYMAYYTIASIINSRKIPAKKLTNDVFGYIFLGKGVPKKVAKDSGIRRDLLEEMRKEFLYFYPVDLRNSGKDLIQNHLTFYVFQHVALWPERFWPKAIGANGYVNVEGEKMSKSKGNIQPLREIIKQFGADLVRINIAASNDGMDDADWRIENVKSLKNRYDFLYGLVKDLNRAKEKGERNIDAYLNSTMQRIIEAATEAYETMKFRTAAGHALFDATNALRWYLRRVGGVKGANKGALRSAIVDITKLLTPLTPHICEDMWKMTGGKGFVSVAGWPKHRENLINGESEMAEELIRNVMSDVDEIKKIAGIDGPESMKIFVADDWKFRVYNKVMRNKDRGINEITKEIMQSGAYGQATVNFIQGLYKRINELRPALPKSRQLRILREAKGFLETELSCKVEIMDANSSAEKKAKQANPQKPGILIE